MKNIVAIVGRPNVGKSTLYNRLVEERKAITDNASGTTRDRSYGLAEWCGVNFTVVDTGGYIKDDTDIFSSEIRTQVEIALKEANAILFVVDCKSGLTGEDQEFAKLLRPLGKPILLVCNKADNTAMSWVANQFFQLGLGDPYPISSASGSGTGELLDDLIKHLNHEYEITTDNIPRIAILGRPNVGKSSFVNSILGESRCVASNIPGTTRDSVDTLYNLYGHNLLLTDTAGIRKKSKEKDDVEFFSTMRSIKAMQNSDVCIVIIDAVQGIEAQDVTLISLAFKYRKGIVILVNKWDLVEKDHKTLEAYKKYLLEKIQPIKDIPIIFGSALTKQRIYNVISAAQEVYNISKTRIPTSKLNEFILPAIEKYPPPAIKGKYVKIKYVTQLPTDHLVIAFFCNLPQYIKPPYKGYLENQLRQNFKLTGVPISLVFRNK